MFIMDNLENICITCLSRNRNLVPVSKLISIIQEIHLLELMQPDRGVCWECSRVMAKFYKFKVQCKQAQTLLSENLQKGNLTSLSTLTSTTNTQNYNHQYIHTFDPLREEDMELKPETKLIKVETKDIVDDTVNNCDDDETGDECVEIDEDHNSDSDYNSKIDVYVENIKSTKYKKKFTKVNSKFDKKTEEEFKGKFDEVVFTEEEMIRSREEKRNQPNFKKIPFKCDTCVLGFMRKETFKLHMEKKHNMSIGSNSCPVCDMRFPNLKAVDRHKRKHYVCYRCRLCRYDTGELWSAVNHCRVKHRDDTANQIHCAQCRAVAKTPEDLAEHMRIEHTLHCNECGEKFKGKNTLRSHKTRIHAVKREFLCDLCKKTFMTKTRLESHMVTHNAAIAKKLAFCSICNIQYKNIYVYRNHLKNSANHSERAYPCPQCNKKFASKVYWTKHYNFYHLHKSQYHCDICNKFFISDWRLKNHKQKHHGLSRSRDHSCNVCGKKFYTLSTLRGHQLTHSEQRSYMCEDCGDTFKQRPALYTHSRLVHKGGKRHK